MAPTRGEQGAPPVQARGRQAIGRSRGGLTTKLHALDANDRIPLIVGLSPGQRHDATRWLALDLCCRPVVPPHSNRRRPHCYDHEVYYRRNEVERFSCRLKRFDRIDNRCDKLDIIFLTAIHLVLIYDMLNSM